MLILFLATVREIRYYDTTGGRLNW